MGFLGRCRVKGLKGLAVGTWELKMAPLMPDLNLYLALAQGLRDLGFGVLYIRIPKIQTLNIGFWGYLSRRMLFLSNATTKRRR